MDQDFSFASRHSRRHTIAPDNFANLLSPGSGAAGSPTKPSPQDSMQSPLSPNAAHQASYAALTGLAFDSNAPQPNIDAVTSRQLKRLSLNFPIQAAAPGTRSRPQSWYGSPIPSPEVPQTPTAGNFLTALAAQERKVLELKEELQKAEQDLQSLKKQWASHEASRKRNDIRSVHPLQPLNTTLANMAGVDEEDTDGSSSWMQKEMERRRALLNGARPSQRKVFSGSRHTRQLSLLSPDKQFTPSFPQPLDIARPSPIEPPMKPSLTRSSTTTDIADQVSENITADNTDLGGLPKDALLRASKQFATDFKDGLLTFIEDLRQATVGEEATNPIDSDPSRAQGGQTIKANSGSIKQARPRPQSLQAMWDTKKGSNDNSALIDIGGSFWKEHGVDEPATTPAKPKSASKSKGHSKKTGNRTADEFAESWENWDTPSHNNKKTLPASSIDSGSEGRTTPMSGRSSTRTSTSSAGVPPPKYGDGYETPLHNSKRDSASWATLDKLSPTNLKRTASHLMKEWERSLTASPSAEAIEANSLIAAKEGKHD